MSKASCRASPSLALLKYWGKLDRRRNTAATPSVALTLGGLHTTTHVDTDTDRDSVCVAGVVQPEVRYTRFLDHIRARVRRDARFRATSHNDFPTAAGLASSSSGFAALTCAAVWASGADLDLPVLSELARMGSASAARSVYGGFVLLHRGAKRAEPFLPPEHWADLRILAVIAEEGAKPVSSRSAMETCRKQSPYYPAWVRSSQQLLRHALRAIEDRDLERVGELARLSAYRMHAVLLATPQPLRFWTARTVAAMDVCATLRARGVGAWETVDAGPQVKILCLQADADRVEQEVRDRLPGARVIRAWPGHGATRA